MMCVKARRKQDVTHKKYLTRLMKTPRRATHVISLSAMTSVEVAGFSVNNVVPGSIMLAKACQKRDSIRLNVLSVLIVTS